MERWWFPDKQEAGDGKSKREMGRFRKNPEGGAQLFVEESDDGFMAFHVGSDVADRLERFGVASVRWSLRLPRDATGRHVAVQWARSATGAGSNYEEARAAESRADFIHKVSVAAKEIREACYWIRIVNGVGWLKNDLSALQREGEELAAILGASARTARARDSQNGK